MLQQLELIGIKPSSVKSNLTQDEWRNEELDRGEGRLSSNGTVIVNTGIYTGRSPNDRFIVKDKETEELIDWGNVNLPLSEESFEILEKAVKKEMNQKDLFVFDGYAGADERYRLPLRVITMMAWQGHFSHNMFIRPTENELENFEPEFTILNASSTNIENWKELGLNSKVFIVLNLKKKMAIIGGTEYGGEIKKSIFSALNFYLPLKGVMPMHCSANIGKSEDSALFFGLSGTGKTTLSTDPNRRLIGDDEHGWSDNGIFNFEGGCYAKTIKLDPSKEPDIFNAIKPGALLENVITDDNGVVDYNDGSITENTRVSYPIDHIGNIESTEQGGHPQNVIFLTCDAFGVLPPISKLTPEMAMYHFLSGYTAKVAGTERGITEPVATFSTCFGAPFMPQFPTTYAELLGQKLKKHNAQAWLVNTGWSGGAYGTGERIDLPITRRMLTAILDDELEKTSFIPDPNFKILVPEEVPGVDSQILNPRNTWNDKKAYDNKANELITLFKNNFVKYESFGNYSKAGPD
ncbi:MAG: phosphoenolpyruvate carboxykinase (ATP) [Marine Group III euryarchaeote CG-Epi3]|jgi:phosphoenolpyruvate carboxykinase (ATP)|uniref:Phosphoenolpyruvate carboxykinase (ATP) n=1 Tax=Marine Group III euryarchaeote CG-Epi3 TaxID=1888997 RepID=A0A1J5TR12_9ARCH|nr:MAG: phosphoenolpyruvate carboxykinase (ATP) [Marine Group III euryarchaeote CG-Epi3]|tara:strand:+ start:8954 stop:10516 length:1563 start_codon:yes stop_codon:yes gene_type:complete